MYQQKLKLAEAFINTEKLETLDSGIAAVLLGGSMVYKYSENDNRSGTNFSVDFDGIMLVRTKPDMIKLVNEKKERLMKLMEIEIEESPGLMLKENSLWFQNTHAVRLAGWDKNGVKKSVKIVNEEYLRYILTNDDFGSCLNILSFKDHKLMTNGILSQIGYTVHQSTFIENDLLLLHEFDMVSITCPRNHGNRLAVLSPTSDMLLTGSWIYEASPGNCGRDITELLLKKFLRVNSAFAISDVTNIFVRRNRFGPSYVKEIQRVSQQCITKFNSTENETQNWCNELCFRNVEFIFGPESIPQKVVYSSIDVYTIPRVDTLTRNVFGKIVENSDNKFVFWKNSEHGKTVDGFFWKKTTSWPDELEGSLQVAKFYRNTTLVPVAVAEDDGVLLYPFFHGKNVAFLRLEYEITKNNHLFEKLLQIELQRTDVILGAFVSSAAMCKSSRQPRLKRLYLDRLEEQNQLKRFYGMCGFKVNGLDISLEELMSMNIFVNGKKFGQLKTMCDQAEGILRRKVFCKELRQLTICGLGDGHCANLLVKNCSKARGQRFDLVNVDYEDSGTHSPWVDLAKPFFSDVFFDVIYADYIKSESADKASLGVQMHFTNDKNSVHFELDNILRNKLARVVYDVKVKYLILPFLRYMASRDDLEVDQEWPIIFGHSLFCCALLARNYSAHPDVFFVNLAFGAVFTQITGFCKETGRFTGLEAIGL